MSFTEILKQILIKFKISDDDHTLYTRDAEALLNHVFGELEKKDQTFADVFVSLSLSGSYLDQAKLDIPNEFDLHMKLKFPFKITPKAMESGFVSLCAKFEPMSMKVNIDGTILQDWLNRVFQKVFTSAMTLSMNDQIYKLSYRMGTYGCAHTITAESKNRTISIDLVPAFEFTGSQWPFADPPVNQKVRDADPWFATALQGLTADGKSFIVSAPQWENALMKDNFKDVLLLMKGLRDANKKRLPQLSSYMMKTVMLHQVAKVNWRGDLGELLLKMWGHLVEHLRKGELEFFLTKGQNLLSGMSSQSRQKCLATADELLKTLREAKFGVDKFHKMFTE